MRFIILGLLCLIVTTITTTVDASRPHHTFDSYNTLPNLPPVPTVTTITTGVSDEDLAAGIATAMAAGGHQFDYSTHDWQGSIVGSYETGEEENAVSFGIGKRFNKMDALLHSSYTQNGGEHYLVFGGTFRF